MSAKKAADQRAQRVQHDAVSALGAGATSSDWTVDRIIEKLTSLYDLHINTAAMLPESMKVRYRVESGMAYVTAKLLAEYFQAQGMSESYALWDYRAKLTESRALGKRNPIADSIGGGRQDNEE